MNNRTLTDTITKLSEDINNYIYKLYDESKVKIMYIERLAEEDREYYSFELKLYNLNANTIKIIENNMEDFKDKINIIHSYLNSPYKIEIYNIDIYDNFILITIDIYEDISFINLPTEMFTFELRKDIKIRDLISLCSTSTQLRDHCQNVIYPDILKNSFIYNYYKNNENNNNINIDRLLLELDNDDIKNIVKKILSVLNDPYSSMYMIKNIINKHKYTLYMFPAIETLKLLQNDDRIKEEYWWIDYRENPLPRDKSDDEPVPWSSKALYYLLNNDIIYDNMGELEINDIFSVALRAGHEDVVQYMIENNIYELKPYLVRNYIRDVIFSRNVELINYIFSLISSYEDFFYYLNLEINKLNNKSIEYMIKTTRGKRHLDKLRKLLQSII